MTILRDAPGVLGKVVSFTIRRCCQAATGERSGDLGPRRAVAARLRRQKAGEVEPIRAKHAVGRSPDMRGQPIMTQSATSLPPILLTQRCDDFCCSADHVPKNLG